MAQGSALLRIAFLGDAFVDVQTTPIRNLPRYGQDETVDAIHLLPGGSAVNTARHFRTICPSLITDLYSTIGDDELARFIHRKLEEEKLATNIEIARGVPQAACIVLPGPSDRAFVSCWGSCSHVSPARLISAERPAHLHFGGYFQCPMLHTRELLAQVNAWKSQGTTFSLDPQYDSSGKWSGTNGHLHELVPLLDYFMPNEYELQMIYKTENAEAALPLFAKAAPNTTLILKCGEAGVKAYKGGALIASAGVLKDAKIVDTTGAGDAFNAGFLGKLLTNSCLETALRYGCAAGGLCVGRLGACDRPLAKAEVDVAVADVKTLQPRMGGAYSCSIGNVVERWETPAVMAVGENWTMDLATRFSAHLLHNTRTRSLVLDRSLNDETATTLLTALKRNTALLHLSLAYCNLTEEIAPLIVSLVEANKSLLWLDLVGNSIPQVTLAQIEGILAPRREAHQQVPLVWSSTIPPQIPSHEDGGAGVRILALDGGGMRCIAQLRMLASLEAVSGKKISELFDLIGVAGLGGIIALSSSSLPDARTLLLRVATEVFSSSAITGALRSNGWYSPDAFAQLLSSHFATRPLLQPKVQPFTFMAAVSSDVIGKPLMLRSYSIDAASLSSAQPPRHALSCSAAQAIQAAASTSTYFSPTTIDSHHPMLDASPSLGSVAEHAVIEATNLWPRAPIKCIVSLGCGAFPPEHHVVGRATTPPLRARIAAEASHRRLGAWLRAWRPSVVYERLDLPAPSSLRWDESSTIEISALEASADAYVSSGDGAAAIQRIAKVLVEGARIGPQ